MKICDLTQSYTSSSGGIRTYIEAKRKYIKHHTNDEYLLIIPGEYDQILKNGQFTTYHISAPLVPGCEPYRFIFRIDKVLKILKTEKPDIIELGSVYLLPWAAFISKFFYKHKIIGYYHTDFPKAYVKPVIKKILGNYIANFAERVTRSYSNIIYKFCNATITSSRVYQHLLSYFDISPVKYVPLGVDLETFHPDKRSRNIRCGYEIKDENLLLIYAGRIDWEKRVELLVRAFELLPESLKAKLFLIGEGPLKSKIQKKAEGNPDINLIPYQQNKSKLAKLLASADIYVTAGPFETFGLSIIEAQASGLPVVGVKAGALIDRVKPNMGCLANVDSFEDIARQIYSLAMSDYQEKGRNARKFVEENFSWENSFYQIIDLYRRLVSEKNYKPIRKKVYGLQFYPSINQRFMNSLLKFQRNFYPDQ